MCIIMSLNVNEMELKDPEQKDFACCDKMARRRKKSRNVTAIDTNFFCGGEHKYLISWPTYDSEKKGTSSAVQHNYKQLLSIYLRKSTTGTQITRGRTVGVIWRGKILMLCEVPKTSVSAVEHRAGGGRGVCVLLCVHTLGVYSPIWSPRRERASFHFSCLIRLSGPAVPHGPQPCYQKH